tara:strand:- start:603 stop:953 length:351 start_codon:yes stop_codon:yes gene_type:complete
MEYKNYFGEGITKGLRARRISDWKAQGVLLKKNQTYKELHNIYTNTTNCEACDLLFEAGRGTNTGQKKVGKCLDHCHKTGYFRQIICRSCNTSDRFVNIYCAKYLKSLEVYYINGY